MDVVKEILKPKYDCLLGIKCRNLKDERKLNLLMELYEHIEDYYRKVCISVKGEGIESDPSSVLITKVLMGTLGCVPAYDRFL